jgi:hypothetical protein
MSDASNQRLIETYMDEAEAPGFLSGFFRSPPENFHNSEKVGIDILRDDEEIAIVVQDLTVGSRANESTLYVNKEFTPAIFDEEGTITAYNMIKRQPGVDPFKDPNFGANAVSEAFRIFRKLERKIRRSVELMCAQVLQTGALTMIDSSGTSLYSLDFLSKSTHKVTVGTVWATDGSTGNPLKDVEDLADVVRQDGKREPTKLVFGSSALQRFLANAKVQASLDKRVQNLGELAPAARGTGAKYYGKIWIGAYMFEIWTYNATYKHPQTGTITRYLDTDKMLMLSDGRLDLTFGAIPMIAGPEQRALPFLPPRMSSSEMGLDLTVNAWFTPDGRHLKVSAGTRPLPIPTAIDTYASLDVVP